MNYPKVEQLNNNQFVIRDGERVIFQSYKSIIAVVDFGKKIISIGSDYNYSTTTGKYRNMFFNDICYFSDLNTLKGLEKALKDGKTGSWTVKKI